MKVTRVTSILCDGGWRPFVFAKVETDEGITGYGECTEQRSGRAIAGLVSFGLTYYEYKQGWVSKVPFLLISEFSNRLNALSNKISDNSPVITRRLNFGSNGLVIEHLSQSIFTTGRCLYKHRV